MEQTDRLSKGRNLRFDMPAEAPIEPNRVENSSVLNRASSEGVCCLLMNSWVVNWARSFASGGRGSASLLALVTHGHQP